MADRETDDKTQYGLREEDYYQIVEANMERRKAKKQNKKKRPNKLLIFALFVAALIGLVVFSFSDYFMIDHIEVKGNKYYTQEEILTMAHASPGSNLIYKPGKKEIIEFLEKNTYIKEVKVKRKFPTTLVIEVVERKQEGAIVYDDEFLIIDKEGVLLRKTQTEPKVTIITGIKIKNIALGEKIGVSKELILNDTLNIINLMGKSDLYFKRLEMSDMYIKAYIYDYLIFKGTYEQIEEAMESGKLHEILEQLFEKGVKRGTITFSEDGYASFKPNF